MARKTTLLCLLYCACLCYGMPYNGDFEFYDYDNAPLGWEYENKAICEAVLYPDVTSGGGPYFWRIDPVAGLKPFSGNRMLTLTTSSSYQTISKAWRIVSVHPGKTIKGMIFWATCDYVPFDDYCTVSLVPLPGQYGTPEIVIERFSVADIGDYSSLGGWKRFQYTFEPNQTGRYYLTFFASDWLDAILSSQMAVDSVVVCENDTGHADLNCDGTVDFKDFAILLKDWQTECVDPLVDCLLGTDINNDGTVDVEDLYELIRYWQCGERANHSRCDFNEDGRVNLVEFANFASQYKNNDPEHDYNMDGIVNLADLVIFQTEYLK